jgi:hypothetical protein
LEACSLTAWLYEGLRHAGLPAICIEARQANAPMKTMPNKTGPQRCPGSGTDHADGLVPGGACQEPAMSVLAFASGRPPHGPQRRGAARVQRDIARLLRSALAGDVAAQPLAARFRPYLGKLVEAFKAACPGRQLEPRQFAAREDMDVRA